MKALKQTEDFSDGRILPSDVTVEKNVIGCIISDPQLFNEVSRILSEDSFYFSPHQIIWQAIVELNSNHFAADTFSVITQLRKDGKLDYIGGAVYPVHLANISDQHAYIENHALWLKELYLRRKLIQLQELSITRLYTNETDVFDEMANTQIEIEKLVNEITAISENHFSDIIVGRVDELKEAAKSKTYKTGVESGLDSLDRQTNGFQPSDLIILAGRPAMGKSALAIDGARKQAKRNIPVGFFSLEMSASQIVDRLLSSETDVDLKTIRRGGMTHDEWQRVDDRVITMVNYPIVVCDKGGILITELCSKAKLWKMKYGIKILYIDYLQLINSGLKGRNREQEVSYISGTLKSLAKDLHIPVIALAQLSRAVETRGGDKVPQLSDLRDSGSLEQDADLVIFPHRPGYYNDKHEQPDLCELYIAKYRNGKTGKVSVRFDGAHQRFEDYGEFQNAHQAISNKGSYNNYSEPVTNEDTPF